MIVRKIFLIASLILNSLAWAKVPAWAQTNGQQLIGSHFIVACHGTGPSLDLARKDAEFSCLNSAQDQLVTNINVKSRIIESENQVTFHQEVSSQYKLENLKCNINGEQMDPIQDGQYGVWIRCNYDLSKAKKVPFVENVPSTIPKASDNTNSWVENRNSLSNPSIINNDQLPRQSLESSSKVITISVIPQCRNLLIRGNGAGRIVTCNSNPISVLLSPEENEIIVQPLGAYLSKTIKLSKARKQDENIQVVLDRS